MNRVKAKTQNISRNMVRHAAHLVLLRARTEELEKLLKEVG